jgi:microcystin-dependent protein
MSDITVNNFKAFYEQIRPYLGAVHSGFTPIGTVISVMGTTAPLNYLACDGTVYNIADYPELASYFTAQFEAANYFGGDGTTTFAVPDLRGEFLRGTGTNSHANQGSGADVGVHQDGTIHNLLNGTPTSLMLYHIAGVNNDIYTGNSGDSKFQYDKNGKNEYPPGTKTIKSITASGATEVNTSLTYNVMTSRPTNTSVLYCIASKNIFMDAGSNYSTEEQVVGTWIDGKPIYQKTFTGSSYVSSNNDISFDISALSIDSVVDVTGCLTSTTYAQTLSISHPDRPTVTQDNITWYVNGANKSEFVIKGGNWKDSTYHFTVQYTKTTDA